MSKAASRGEGIISIAKVETDLHLHYSPSMLAKPQTTIRFRERVHSWKFSLNAII